MLDVYDRMRYGQRWVGSPLSRNPNATVPQPEINRFEGRFGEELQVPCQEQVPMGMEGMCFSHGRMNNLFRCMDGTVIDIGRRRVLMDGNDGNG